MTRYEVTKTPIHDGYELKIEIVESDVIPLEAFVYRIETDDKRTFTNVATIHDINTIPPHEEVGKVFFRKMQYLKTFKYIPDLEKELADRKTEIEDLITAYKTMLEVGGYNETISYSIE